jgi:hypothetical protein
MNVKGVKMPRWVSGSVTISDAFDGVGIVKLRYPAEVFDIFSRDSTSNREVGKSDPADIGFY